MSDLLQNANELLKHFDQIPKKWEAPFPMGVFGTLRKDCGNDPLMGRSQHNLQEYDDYFWTSVDCLYYSHHKAFLPHFVAAGLSIRFQYNCAAVFEVYTYRPDEWIKMIPPVDRLESFDPNNYRWGYWRTLAWLHILPDDYQHEQFEKHLSNGARVLPIPQKEWNDYPRVPCWIYSSREENEKCRNCLFPEGSYGSPIIWFG